MKKSDIKVGEEYAVDRHRASTYPDRVRVVEIDVERLGRFIEVGARARRTHQDGIRVAVLDRDTGEQREHLEHYGGRKMVPWFEVYRAADFHDTWEGWTAAQAAAEATREAARKAREVEAKSVAKRLDKVLPADDDLPYGLQRENLAERDFVSISKSRLADLLEAVAANAHRRALGG